MRHIRLSRFALAFLAIQSAAVQAQAVLEEVVVTAQKREESQQDVPISVSALSGEQLQSQNLVELESLSAQMPNIHISESAIGDKLFIRGIGSGINAGFEQSVGTFIDGVYYGRSLQTRSQFLDIERVEVLRGPQSTFFGNNAIAGALNIATRKPTDELSGYVNSFYEFEHNEHHLEGAIGGSISDTLAVRVAGLVSGLDGWVQNLNTGDTEGEEDNQAGRISIAWTPTDSFDATLKLEHGDFDVLGRNLEVLGCPPATGAAGTCQLTTVPVLARFGPSFAAPLFSNFDDRFDAKTQYNAPVPAAYTAAVNSIGAMEAGRAIPAPRADISQRDVGELSNDNATLTLNLELPGGHMLTSVTGLSEYDFYIHQSSDFMPIPAAGVSQLEGFEQQSQELRIVSPGGATVDWLAGLYWQQSELAVREEVSLYFPAPYFQPASTYFTDPCRAPARATDPTCRLPATIADTLSNHRQDEDSQALFASFTWNINDSWRATFGGRYMRVDKSLDRRQSMTDLAPGVTVPCPPALAGVTGCTPGLPLLLTANNPPRGTAFGWRAGTLQLAREDSDFMPNVNVQWDLRDDVMLYATYTEGFKAGGFDQRNLFLNAQSGQFGPEGVDAWELGLKSRLLDGNMLFNMALFRSDYDDLQVSTFDGVVNFLVNNAATARTQGIETDVRWLVNDSIILSGAFALLDAQWNSFPNAQCTALSLVTAPNAACRVDAGTGLLVQDLSGDDLLMSPAYSGNFSVEHFLPLGSGLDVESQLLVYFEDDKYLAADNDPATLQESFAKLNLRVALVSDTGWEVALVGRNLTDELTSAHSEDLPLRSVNTFFRLTDRTRTWAVQGQYRF